MCTELIEVVYESLRRSVDVLVPDGAVGQSDVHGLFGPDATGAVDVGDVRVLCLHTFVHVLRPSWIIVGEEILWKPSPAALVL